MKKAFTFMFIALFFSVALTFSASTVQAQPTPGTECTDPTTEITVKAQTGLAFDKDKISVPRATCVNITLVNEDPDIEHDFTIDGKSGEIETVYIPVAVGETASFAVMTPDKDVTYDFYCSVTGHRAAGMEGSFVVGEGSPEDDSPGFGFWLSFTAFLALVALVPRIRKH